MECPSCKVEMIQLLENIYQCPKCRKIQKEKKESILEDDKKESLLGNRIDGDWFHSNVAINQSYEIVECGFIINKTPSRLIAVLVCHSSLLKTDKYIRISWWKKSFYQHAGMIKIYDKAVLDNLITTLEKFDANFDEMWNWKGKHSSEKKDAEKEAEKQKKLDIIKYRIIENKTCPRCQKKMEKMKFHYECQHCGEIVVLEGYNQPIFNLDSTDLELKFHSNFPINFYMPVSGVTIKWLMGEWKALVVIYSKDNPNKMWLRFYWWTRDLRNIINHGFREIGNGVQMGWKAQRGSGSPNLYNKSLIKPLIEALNKAATELK